MSFRNTVLPFVLILVGILAVVVPEFAPVTGAATLNVPDDYPSIQAAVNAASNGDVIVVGLKPAEALDDYGESVIIDGFDGLTLLGKKMPAIDGGPGPDPCITIRDSSNVTVSGFYMIRCTNGGLRVNKSHNVFVTKCQIGGNGGHNVHTTDCTDFTITKCHIYSSTGCGILDLYSDGYTILKNQFEIAIQDGINLSANQGNPGTQNVLISGNRMRLAHGRAITVGGSGIRIDKNKIWDSLQAIGNGSGISLDASADTTGAVVEKNKLWDLKGYGVFVSGDGNRVLKNKLTNVGIDDSEGIRVVGENHVVGGNKITVTQDIGISLEAMGCSFLKNKVAGTNSHGFFVLGDDNVFLGNKVGTAGVDGFHVSTGSIDNDFTKNKASGSGGFDLNDNAPLGDNTYEKNKFETTQQAPP